MPQVHFVKKAQKDYPEADIKKGDSYYWWKFKFGGKHKSKTHPKASQLTQSEFLSAIYDLEDRIRSLSSDMDIEDIEAEVTEIIDEIRTLGEEQEEKRNNMPESLQDGEIGELLQSRADACEEWASELENVDFDTAKDDEDEDIGDVKQELIDNIQGCQYQGE